MDKGDLARKLQAHNAEKEQLARKAEEQKVEIARLAVEARSRVRRAQTIFTSAQSIVDATGVETTNRSKEYTVKRGKRRGWITREIREVTDSNLIGLGELEIGGSGQQNYGFARVRIERDKVERRRKHGLLRRAVVVETSQDDCLYVEFMAGGRNGEDLTELSKVSMEGASYHVPLFELEDKTLVDVVFNKQAYREASIMGMEEALNFITLSQLNNDSSE